jgi:beta-aspartyl-peptidase (threonine type)
MVMELARLRRDEFPDRSLSGLGGIETGEDAAQFILLGADTVQVCTGVMKSGYGMVRQMRDSLLAFMDKHGFETVENSYFETEERRAQLDKVLAAGGHFDADVKYGTIGAVAVDEAGHVAAATSTGGLTAKRWGRIGDSPLIGVGTYADDRAAAISATGSGEYFIRAVAAHQVADRVRLCERSLQQAIDETLADIREMGGTGGLIAVAPSGEAAWGFTTSGMYRGVAGPHGRTVAVYKDDL